MTRPNRFQQKCTDHLKNGCPVCGSAVSGTPNANGDASSETFYACGARFAVSDCGVEALTGCRELARLVADDINQMCLNACRTPEEVLFQ